MQASLLPALTSVDQLFSLHSKNNWMCHICMKKFKSRYAVKEHVEFDHLNIAKFSCRYCNKPMKREQAKLQHERNCDQAKSEDDQAESQPEPEDDQVKGQSEPKCQPEPKGQAKRQPEPKGQPKRQQARKGDQVKRQQARRGDKKKARQLKKLF